jgi:hypothetical protein
LNRIAVSSLAVGLVFLVVGIGFRFAPRVERTSPWWPGALVVAIMFGYAPRSWIPWGSATLLVGIAAIIGEGTVIGGMLNLLAVGFLAAGVVVLFWRPSWLEPRSLPGATRPKRGS